MRHLLLSLLLIGSAAWAQAPNLDRNLDCKKNVKRISLATDDSAQKDDYTIYSCQDGWHFNLKDGRVIVASKKGGKWVSCVKDNGKDLGCCPSGSFTNNLTPDKSGDSATT